MRAAVLALLGLLATAFAPLAQADYFVVVHEDNPVQQLSRKDVLHLFMGRARHFPGGGGATVYDVQAHPKRDGFYRLLAGMSLPQVTSYWARLMFSGRSLPPQRVESEAEMIARVSRDPDAIGWLAAPPKQKGLRTVLVLEESP